MPVIEKPEHDDGLFGCRVQVLLGGPVVHQLRQWKKRKTASLTNEEEA